MQPAGFHVYGVAVQAQNVTPTSSPVPLYFFFDIEKTIRSNFFIGAMILPKYTALGEHTKINLASADDFTIPDFTNM